MRQVTNSVEYSDQKAVILSFPVLKRAGIPQSSEECAVYWTYQTNVESNPFDAEYLERLKARDPRTQEHFAGHFNRLLEIKLRCTGIYGSKMDDLRQDTFIRVLRSIYEGKIDSPQSLPAFVYGVCNNVIHEFNRGERIQRTRDTDEFPDLPDPRYTADHHVRYQEMRKAVAVVMAALPEKDRAILHAVFIAEKDKDAICREFGITRDYRRVLLHRALLNARKLLDKDNDRN